MSYGAMLQQVGEREAEIERLKRKINALLDAIGEHASKAAGRRIIAAMKAKLKESGDAV